MDGSVQTRRNQDGRKNTKNSHLSIQEDEYANETTKIWSEKEHKTHRSDKNNLKMSKSANNMKMSQCMRCNLEFKDTLCVCVIVSLRSLRVFSRFFFFFFFIILLYSAFH